MISHKRYQRPRDPGHEGLVIAALVLENTQIQGNPAAVGVNHQRLAAAAVALGGNVRVGLEDNLFLDRGVLATNAQLVERAQTIIESMGAKVLTPQQARNKLKLRGAGA